jgi:hypothetical protein
VRPVSFVFLSGCKIEARRNLHVKKAVESCVLEAEARSVAIEMPSSLKGRIEAGRHTVPPQFVSVGDEVRKHSVGCWQEPATCRLLSSFACRFTEVSESSQDDVFISVGQINRCEQESKIQST